MNSKQESRYQSFRIDFDASSGSIRYLYPRSNVMDVYTTEATFQIELAETIDPLGKNPNVPHIYKKISDFGSKNQIISRLIIELDEFTKLLPKSLQPLIRDDWSQAKDRLIHCQQIEQSINKKIAAINNQLSAHSNIQHPVFNLPQINNLKIDSDTFLQEAKLYLQNLSEIYNKLFNTDFTGPHFHKIAEDLEKKYGKTDELYEFVANNEKYFISIIVNWRNAIEHPSKHKMLHVKNFSLSVDNKISFPSWIFNNETPIYIHEQMTAFVEGLLEFGEIFYILCTQRKAELPSWILLKIKEIQPEDQDPDCQIKYIPIFELANSQV